MNGRRTWTAQLTEASALGPAVRHLVLQVQEPEGFRWLPGQYVQLFERSVPERRFAYSIASTQLDEAPGRFELAVGRDGSAYAVDALRVGDTIEVIEPRGSFVRPLGSSMPAVFIGVGTGVAPLRAMIQAALRQTSRASLTLLFGCRSEEELLWGHEFSRWTQDERFGFLPTLSRPSASWSGRTGYVQAHVESLGVALETAEFFVCGSRGMVDDLAARLGSLGVPAERLKLEGY
jgi:CDP-4-dehydro-6-deoxyglucose reductase